MNQEVIPGKDITVASVDDKLDLLLMGMNKMAMSINALINQKLKAIDNIITDDKDGLEHRLQLVQDQIDDNTARIHQLQAVNNGMRQEMDF